MRRADTGRVHREDGFTLLEMLVVLVVMATLGAVAVGFSSAARVSAADVSAKSNIEVAVRAISAYGAEHDGFTGMTLDELRSTYSRGVSDITIVSADATTYCVTSAVEGRTWYKRGPAGALTTTPCS